MSLSEIPQKSGVWKQLEKWTKENFEEDLTKVRYDERCRISLFTFGESKDHKLMLFVKVLV